MTIGDTGGIETEEDDEGPKNAVVVYEGGDMEAGHCA